MIEIWLKHKILEYCIDIFFREFFKNFIFPQILPQMHLIIKEDMVIIEDGQHNTLSRKLNYKATQNYLYVEEITIAIMDFLRKYRELPTHSCADGMGFQLHRK